jgi:hypothetical protein
MKVGFDIDNYDFTEYASALDGENLSSTDCDMESESIWTPARRHKKRKASASPLNQLSFFFFFVKICKSHTIGDILLF